MGCRQKVSIALKAIFVASSNVDFHSALVLLFLGFPLAELTFPQLWYVPWQLLEPLAV